MTVVEDKDYCHLCQIALTSTIVALQHYNGKSHAKQQKKMTDGLLVVAADDDKAYCHLCQIALTSTIVALQHYNGKSHAKQKTLTAAIHKTQNTSVDKIKEAMHGKKKNVVDIKDTNLHVCNVCNITANGSETMKMHLLGKPHKKELDKQENIRRAKFFCDLCQIETSDLAGLECHKSGKKHKKKLASSSLILEQCNALNAKNSSDAETEAAYQKRVEGIKRDADKERQGKEEEIFKLESQLTKSENELNALKLSGQLKDTELENLKDEDAYWDY